MFKKIATISLMIILLFTNLSFADDFNYFNKENINNGSIQINYPETDKKIKVMIRKGNDKTFYDLANNNVYSFKFGNGDYQVAVLEHTTGSKYKLVDHKKVTVDLKDTFSIFTLNTHSVSWSEDMASIEYAKEITKDLDSNLEKAEAIYNYIVENFQYDYEKAANLKQTFIPNIDSVYEIKKGICLDFATLYASMLRSLNIPTKVVKGYKNDIETYHAWNEVYINETLGWITVDTTYDITLHENNLEYNFIKNSEDYQGDSSL